MDINISQFIFSTFQESFEFMRPALSNYQTFSENLSKEVKTKEGNNIQYEFDIEVDRIVKKQIENFNIEGAIFSEESGFFEFGENKYRVVYDPFCNSSLASKTFHEAAIGISIFSYDYRFITSAIMDYQTGIVGIVEDVETVFYQIQSREKITFDKPKNETIESSWIVITLENQKERKEMTRALSLLSEAKRIIISSGHLYWLKLATGVVDGYLDPFGGEKLYEMFACTVAQKSGCTVSNLDGKIFDPVENLKIFEKNQNFIYHPVAATNKELHDEILKNIK